MNSDRVMRRVAVAQTLPIAHCPVWLGTPSKLPVLDPAHRSELYATSLLSWTCIDRFHAVISLPVNHGLGQQLCIGRAQ